MDNEICVEERLDFDWNVYKNGYVGPVRLIPNEDIIGNDNIKKKCFSREPYAQKMFDMLTDQNSKVIKKDLQEGELIEITNIVNIKGTVITIELLGGLRIDVDLNREKNLVKIFGYNNPRELIEVLHDEDMVQKFLDNNITAYILETTPNIKVSLWQGYISGIRKEFMLQIKEPTKAYTSKVIDANKGGFLVSLQGLDAFLPGALAAANKIIDYQSYVGKEIIVMIEDYLVEKNSFIVSHKRYLQHIMPEKMKELDMTRQYTGIITGAKHFGVFVEFADFYTGLMHISKMSPETKERLSIGGFKQGDEMIFYISEISKDNKIILSEEDPQIKLKKIETFIFECKDRILNARVIAKLEFGLLVETENEKIIGSIPYKRSDNLKDHDIGDIIEVMFNYVNGDKLIFKLW
jgi:ribosomal protein S1